MPDFSTQFDLSSTNCVANGQFETGANWAQTIGEDADIEIGDGRLTCTGNGRNAVRQTVSGGGLQTGDIVLLMVECVSGGGVCSFGDGGIGLSPGTHCRLVTVTEGRDLTFDFEDTAAEIDSVKLRKATFPFG